MSLAPGFKLERAKPEDMPAVWAVMMAAFVEDKVWELWVAQCKHEDLVAWVMATFAPRWAMPDIKTYKVTEESSGKIVGWTALQFPWKACLSMTPKLKAMALSHDVPPLCEGMQLEVAVEMFTLLGLSATLGYDPEVDYHRKGTMILPEYQRRGFARQLTRRCNAIADEAGVRTWVPARSKSVNMFKTEGFKEVAIRESKMAQYGGIDGDWTWYLLREAAPLVPNPRA